MMDLALLAKLLQALPEKGCLILIGDKDQLASVEAGSILGDICNIGPTNLFSKSFLHQIKRDLNTDLNMEKKPYPKHGIQDCIVQLQKGYRFGSDSGIGLLSKSVKKGDAIRAFQILENDTYSDCLWESLPEPDQLAIRLKPFVEEWIETTFLSQDLNQILQALNRFRLLCALRVGPYGSQAINAWIEKKLLSKSQVKPVGIWYPGRPIMITVNDYELNLFNGDTGIVLPDIKKKNELRGFFPTMDGSFRTVHPSRLPQHETVFAMTVHKSQGSEFDQVMLILPDRDTPLLSRELIYTGLTRARNKVTIWGRDSVFKNAVHRQIRRSSGLQEGLWDLKNSDVS
jgi:exodeoxyribonuclease V alpha subunit